MKKNIKNKPLTLNFCSGFTLIELLIVIAIIAVIAVVVFVALNPAERFKTARNATRWSDVRALVDAVRLYQFDHKGLLPPGLDQNLKMLGTAVSGCNIGCGIVGGSSSTAFVQGSQSDFSSGSFSNTVWDSVNSVVKLSSVSSGSYTSPVFDSSVSSTSWNTFSWIPTRPFYKELPGNSQTEFGYSFANADMSGNVLLLHLNESSNSTAFVDSSSNSNNGICSGTTCPVAGVTGKLNTALSFDGVNDRLSLSKTGSFNNKITVSAWVKPIIADATAPSIAETIYNTGLQGNSGFHLFYLVKYSGTKQVRVYWQYSNSSGSGNTFYALGNAINVSGLWKYLTVSHDYTAKQIKIYVNGVLVKTTNHTDVVVPVNNKSAYVGSYQNSGNFFNGTMDELSVFNRVLSDQEVLDQYRRGANRLQFQIRSCDDPSCVGESFIGPSGTSASYYSELNSNSSGLPIFNLSGVSPNQFFQYRAYFDTDNVNYSPELKSINLAADFSGSGQVLSGSCLDLSGELASKLANFPVDPSLGTNERTYYAIKKEDNGQIKAVACAAEGEIISISK